MKFDNLRSFEKYFTDPTTSRSSSIYLINAKESLEREEALNLLVRFLRPSKRKQSCLCFEGEKVSEQELSEALQSRLLFEPSSLIILKQADKLKKSLQALVEQFLEDSSPLHVLILMTSSISKNSNFYKAIEKKGLVLDWPEEKPWEKEKRLMEFAQKAFNEERKTLSYPACQSLVRRSQGNVHLLSQEIEKLICLCDQKKEVTLQDVEAISSYPESETIWKLGEAIFSFEVSHSLKIARRLLEEGTSFLTLLRQIRTQFQTDYQVALMHDSGKTDENITSEFPYMRDSILKKHIQNGKNYGLERFRKGLIVIDEMEAKAKNAFADEEILLELLIMKLLG